MPEGFGRTGTWDEWLMLRPNVIDQTRSDPGAVPRNIPLGQADLLAFSLRQGLFDMVDLTHRETRDAFRELFDEFERDTAGQTVTWREGNAHLTKDMTYQSLEVGTNDAKTQIFMSFMAGNGITYRLPFDDLAHPAKIGAMLYTAARQCGFTPPHEEEDP